MGLQYIKDPHFVVFEAYLNLHFQEIQQQVLDNGTVEETDKSTTKADIMTMLSNVIKNCSDEQIKVITANPVI
jgi:hypothetical protein